MLLQSLRALCLSPGWSGSVWKYLEALVRSPGVSGRIACGFRTELHFAAAEGNILFVSQVIFSGISPGPHVNQSVTCTLALADDDAIM